MHVMLPVQTMHVLPTGNQQSLASAGMQHGLMKQICHLTILFWEGGRGGGGGGAGGAVVGVGHLISHSSKRGLFVT